MAECPLKYPGKGNGGGCWPGKVERYTWSHGSGGGQSEDFPSKGLHSVSNINRLRDAVKPMSLQGDS